MNEMSQRVEGSGTAAERGAVAGTGQLPLISFIIPGSQRSDEPDPLSGDTPRLGLPRVRNHCGRRRFHRQHSECGVLVNQSSTSNFLPPVCLLCRMLENGNQVISFNGKESRNPFKC